MTPLCTGASACATINIKYPRQENTIKSQVLQQWIALGFLRYSTMAGIQEEVVPVHGVIVGSLPDCWHGIQTDRLTYRQMDQLVLMAFSKSHDDVCRTFCLSARFHFRIHCDEEQIRDFSFFPLVVHIFSRNITGTSGRYLLGDLVVVVAVEGLDGRPVVVWCCYCWRFLGWGFFMDL